MSEKVDLEESIQTLVKLLNFKEKESCENQRKRMFKSRNILSKLRDRTGIFINTTTI